MSPARTALRSSAWRVTTATVLPSPEMNSTSNASVECRCTTAPTSPSSRPWSGSGRRRTTVSCGFIVDLPSKGRPLPTLGRHVSQPSIPSPVRAVSRRVPGSSLPQDTSYPNPSPRSSEPDPIPQHASSRSRGPRALRAHIPSRSGTPPSLVQPDDQAKAGTLRPLTLVPEPRHDAATPRLPPDELKRFRITTRSALPGMDGPSLKPHFVFAS